MGGFGRMARGVCAVAPWPAGAASRLASGKPVPPAFGRASSDIGVGGDFVLRALKAGVVGRA